MFNNRYAWSMHIKIWHDKSRLTKKISFTTDTAHNIGTSRRPINNCSSWLLTSVVAVLNMPMNTILVYLLPYLQATNRMKVFGNLEHKACSTNIKQINLFECRDLLACSQTKCSSMCSQLFCLQK